MIIGTNVYRFGSLPDIDRMMHLMSDYSVIRFMDWLPVTIPNHTAKTAFMPLKFDDMLYSTGDGSGNWYEVGCMVSLIDMCAIANSLEARAWFCIPHRMNAYEARCMVEYVAERCNHGVIIEFSNEVWNTQFYQHAECRDLGADVGGGDDWTAAMVYSAVKMSEIAQTCAGIENVEFVYGCWSANVWSANKMLNETGIGSFVDALAIAPYLNGSSVATLYDDMPDVAADVTAYRDLCNRHGLKLYCYEAGQHATRNADAVARSHQTGALYADYYEMLESCGVDLVCDYAIAAPYSSGGAWGAWEIDGGELLATPRLLGLPGCNSND